MGPDLTRRLVFRNAAAAFALLATRCSAPPPEPAGNTGAGQKQSWFTGGYAAIRAKDPLIDDAARSVGYVNAVLLNKDIGGQRVDVVEFAGSALLLDKFGTICITNHQSLLARAKAVSVDFVQPETGAVQRFKASIDWFDKKLDIAFGTIEADAIQEGLKEDRVRPIKWGATNFARFAENVPVSYVGYPGSVRGLLHAVTGAFGDFLDNLPTNLGVVSCKIMGSKRIYNGMSGGGVFGPDKKCLGMLNNSFNFLFVHITGFTPSEAILGVYKSVYPERYRKSSDAGVFRDMRDIKTPDLCRPATPIVPVFN